MKSSYHRVAVLLTLLVTLLVGHLPPVWGQGPPGLPSRPVIYEFSRKLCPIGKQAEQVLKAAQDRYGEQLEVRVLYIEEDFKLFRQFRVSLVPTQIFLETSGKEVFRHEGPITETQLLQKLRQLGWVKE